MDNTKLMPGQKRDGGAAFPSHYVSKDMRGMSLRDWFAGQALSGLISRLNNIETINGVLKESKSENLDPYNYLAKVAYEHADEMLIERKKDATST